MLARLARVAEPTIVTLPIFVRRRLGVNGETAGMVRCPRTDGSRDARDCFRCERLLSRRWDPTCGGEVVCTAGSGKQVAKADGRADFAEVSARCRVIDVLEPTTTCVGAETPVKELLYGVPADDWRALVIVDDEQRVVGTVTRAALVGASSKDAPVSDVMVPVTHVLSEHAPIAHAIAIMAFEDIDGVPVITESRELVGLLQARSVFRWVAERIGYVPPQKRAAGPRRAK